MWLKKRTSHESHSKQTPQTSCLLFRVTKRAFEGKARSHTATGLGKGLLQLGDNWIIHGQKLRLAKGTNLGHHRLGEKVVGLEVRRKRLFQGNSFPERHRHMINIRNPDPK